MMPNNRALLEKCKNRRRKMQQQQEEEMIDEVNVDEDLAEEIEENIENDGLIEFEQIGTALWHEVNNRNNQIDQPMNSTALSLNPPPPRRIVVGAVTRGHPIHPPAFWNIHKEAIEASPRTNNAMESSHCHFSKSLGCHPSMSDYLMAFWDNFDKQLDNNRSTKLMPATNANRKPRYVNREAAVQKTLKEAQKNESHQRKYVIRMEDVQEELLQNAGYGSQQAIIGTLDRLAHHLGYYFAGLRIDVEKIGDEESANEDEANDENDDESEEEYEEFDENDDPTDDFIRDIKRPILRSPTPTIDLNTMPSTSSQSQPIY